VLTTNTVPLTPNSQKAVVLMVSFRNAGGTKSTSFSVAHRDAVVTASCAEPNENRNSGIRSWPRSYTSQVNAPSEHKWKLKSVRSELRHIWGGIILFLTFFLD